MLKDTCIIQPRYHEVDKMGYVYHANYVAYCHQARTELLRKFGINDRVLEKMGIMMPVIEMNLKYHCPAHYDAPLVIKTVVDKFPATRFSFKFEFRNEKEQLVCSASSTVVFADTQTRRPMRIPEIVKKALSDKF